MKAKFCFAAAIACLVVIPCAARAQTEGAAAIARETHVRQADQQVPVLPPRVVSPPIVTDAVVRERLPARVADGLVPTRVIDQTSPAVITPPGGVVESIVTARPVIATSPPATWLSTFSSMRYGYYDDGLVDDNWFYDYYEIPARAVVQPPTSSAPGYRTAWRYDPTAEQRLFRW